jgi:hypothetical protein
MLFRNASVLAAVFPSADDARRCSHIGSTTVSASVRTSGRSSPDGPNTERLDRFGGAAGRSSPFFDDRPRPRGQPRRALDGSSSRVRFTYLCASTVG